MLLPRTCRAGELASAQEQARTAAAGDEGTNDDAGAGRDQREVGVREKQTGWEQALAAGAEVIEELGDHSYGHRNFTVADPDGHHWCFAEAAG